MTVRVSLYLWASLGALLLSACSSQQLRRQNAVPPLQPRSLIFVQVNHHLPSDGELTTAVVKAMVAASRLPAQINVHAASGDLALSYVFHYHHLNSKFLARCEAVVAFEVRQTTDGVTAALHPPAAVDVTLSRVTDWTDPITSAVAGVEAAVEAAESDEDRIQ